jgi:hypothetical protein
MATQLQYVAFPLTLNHPTEMDLNNTVKDSIRKVVLLLDSLLWGGDQHYIQNDEPNHHMTLLWW